MEGATDPTGLIPADLSVGPILLVNDDGIEARGFAALENLAARLGAADVVAVAPADGRSAASAMLSLRKQVDIDPRGEKRFAITGSPADCVLAGLNLLLDGRQPSLVLSGVNHGANVGDDMAFSGTVGAATMAAVHGIPAMALSLEHGPGRFESDAAFDICIEHGVGLVRRLCAAGFAPGLLYNINFPHLEAGAPAPPVTVCRQGAQGGGSFVLEPHPDPTRAGFRVWHHGDRGVDQGDSDYAMLRAGHITVTPVRADRTDAGALARLTDALTGIGAGPS